MTIHRSVVTAPICLDVAQVDADLRVSAEDLGKITTCPRCGGEIEGGFGLMGGGYGPYVFCAGDPGCDFMRKTSSDEDEDDDGEASP